MDEKISKLFLPLLDKLYNQEPAGEPFRKPVDVVKYGCYDYYHYVKHPIDLSTIRDKLTSKQYKDAWRFVADVQLMLSNAYLFNKKGTTVYEFTNKLSKIWTTDLPPVMQRLNYCCGTLHKFGPQLLFCHGTTPDRYCQIAIGAKYRCYLDQYSFCVPCFNKIDTEYINIQNLSCETTRMKLPTQPVKKSDFMDCANDNWQYEQFIQCNQCSKRVHQICELYPADDEELQACIQHSELELEQKMLCRVPDEYLTHEPETSQDTLIEDVKPRDTTKIDQNKTAENKHTDSRPSAIEEINLQTDGKLQDAIKRPKEESATNPLSPLTLDDELLQFARDVEDANFVSAPNSPNVTTAATTTHENKNTRVDGNKKTNPAIANVDKAIRNNNVRNTLNHLANQSSSKNSVDKIAARLSINKLSANEAMQSEEAATKSKDNLVVSVNRDKFVCNHCYRKKKIGFNLRHRKYSARRLLHTRMSRYIETKVNEHIRENAPTAGEVTIRILTAYRDTFDVKPEMNDFVNKSRQRQGQPQHPNLDGYPEQFEFTNRAIFAWQEIDGVDVCVFGMHVQEYGDDCPEPNKQVVYLSYLDSVNFFRPKQFRTAVYHEILLSYFKYVKKLGFKRVFIWVCPSRKGDDYIFYRHPSEQKMPTLKRLLDWYINLLDKGIIAGIVEKHHNIYQYANTQNWSSLLSMPYFSGDYWPGEFERLLKIMIESQKEYEVKLQQLQQRQQQQLHDSDVESITHSDTISMRGDFTDAVSTVTDPNIYTSLYHSQPPIINQSDFKLINSLGLKSAKFVKNHQNFGQTDPDFSNLSMRNQQNRQDFDQPLDLSKSSSTASPESYYDDDQTSELSFKSSSNNKNKKRKKIHTMGGYTKRRSRPSTQIPNQLSSMTTKSSLTMSPYDIVSRSISTSSSQPVKQTRQRSSTQSQRDSQNPEILLRPEDELSKNLERSLKRQKDGFIVARLSECDCSPHFESQRRKEETLSFCEMMKGREPFLQLARLKNYEFSTLRRAKFSSLAMIKHLGQYFKLDPICNECFSFDSSKRHYACSHCHDFYLCTSCHENTHHEHIMSLMAPSSLPDIDEFLQDCSSASTTNSISSASSTISNKSFNDSNMDISCSQTFGPTLRNHSHSPVTNLTSKQPSSTVANMPLSCQRQQRNRAVKHQPATLDSKIRNEDEENAEICPFGTSTRFNLTDLPSPPPSHSATTNIRNLSSTNIELDQVLMENFVRQAEVSYDVDFDQLKNESKKLLTHYYTCPIKDTCSRCKFVVMSCSFMSVFMRSTRMQMMMINCSPNEFTPNSSNNNLHPSGINLTPAHRFNYQPQDK